MDFDPSEFDSIDEHVVDNLDGIDLIVFDEEFSSSLDVPLELVEDVDDVPY